MGRGHDMGVLNEGNERSSANLFAVPAPQGGGGGGSCSDSDWGLLLLRFKRRRWHGVVSALRRMKDCYCCGSNFAGEGDGLCSEGLLFLQFQPG